MKHANTIRTVLIQSGESTHHQDHAMCPVSFSVTKISVRIVITGKEAELVDNLLHLSIFYKVVNYNAEQERAC